MPNRLPSRYFAEQRRATPPSGGFGGVDPPAFWGHAAATRLLRNRLIRVRPQQDFANHTVATYEAWRDPADGSVLLTTGEEARRQRAAGLLSAAAELAWRFEAATWEEANAIHSLRMGWEPYRPAGRPAPCPACGAMYYPEGSAQCWQCGPRG
jgi:hypothetical protein